MSVVYIGQEKKEFAVLCFTGYERVSFPFLFKAQVLDRKKGVSGLSPKGETVTLSLFNKEKAEKKIEGVVFSYKKMKGNVCELIIVPEFFLLLNTCSVQVFSAMTVLEIIHEVFSRKYFGKQIKYRFDLSNNYNQKKDFFCYNESLVDFLNRVLSDLGVYYYFDHNNESELVFSDQVVQKKHKKRCFPSQAKLKEAPKKSDIGLSSLDITMKGFPNNIAFSGFFYPEMGNGEESTEQTLIKYLDKIETEKEAQRYAEEMLTEKKASSYLFRATTERFTVQVADPLSFTPFYPQVSEDNLTVCEILYEYHRESKTRPNLCKQRCTFIAKPVGAVKGYTKVKDQSSTGPIRGRINAVEEVVDERGHYYVNLPLSKRSFAVPRVHPYTGNNSGVDFPLEPGTVVALDFLQGNHDQGVIEATVTDSFNINETLSFPEKAHKIETLRGGGIAFRDEVGSKISISQSKNLPAAKTLSATEGCKLQGVSITDMYYGDFIQCTAGNHLDLVGGAQVLVSAGLQTFASTGVSVEITLGPEVHISPGKNYQIVGPSYSKTVNSAQFTIEEEAIKSESTHLKQDRMTSYGSTSSRRGSYVGMQQTSFSLSHSYSSDAENRTEIDESRVEQVDVLKEQHKDVQRHLGSDSTESDLHVTSTNNQIGSADNEVINIRENGQFS